MVALAEYQNGTYEVKNGIVVMTMLCVSGRWYYDKKSYEVNAQATPPLLNESVKFIKEI